VFAKRRGIGNKETIAYIRRLLWPNPRKCINARPSIAVVFMIRIEGTAEVKSPRESGLKKPRMTGVARFAAPAKNVSGRWQVPDL
jgi:hypothetical protein